MKDPTLNWFGLASQIEPHDGVGDHPKVDHGVPQLLVCFVSLWWDHKLRELLGALNVGSMSSIVLVEVNALDHELTGLLIIRQIHNESKLLGLSAEELLQHRRVLLAVSRLRVTLIQNSLNLRLVSDLVIAEVLDILREPSPVHEDTAWPIVLVEMRVERSDDLNSLFLVLFFFNHNLLADVQIALQGYGLHVPFLGKL